MLEKDIQIKIKVNNFQKMKKFLMSKGAIFFGKKKQLDLIPMIRY